MTLFVDMLAPLIASVIDLCREAVVQVWGHPFLYGVTFSLLAALALWGWFCLRFVAPMEHT